MSNVATVRNLEGGEEFIIAKFIPASDINPRRLRETKRRLGRQLSKLLSRADGNGCRMHVTHAFTESYDVVVIGMIVADNGV